MNNRLQNISSSCFLWAFLFTSKLVAGVSVRSAFAPEPVLPIFISAQMVQGEQIVVNVFDPKTQKIERTPISLSQLAELQDSRLQKAITLSLENQSSWQNPESL